MSETEPLAEPTPYDGKRCRGWAMRIKQASLWPEWTAFKRTRNVWHKNTENYDARMKQVKMEFLPSLEVAEQGRDIKAPQAVNRRELALGRLADKVAPSKSCTLEEERSWARNHYLMDPRKIEAGKVPSRGAVMILVLAEQNPKFRMDLFTKSAQTKEPIKEVATDGGISEHDQQILELTSRVEKDG